MSCCSAGLNKGNFRNTEVMEDSLDLACVLRDAGDAAFRIHCLKRSAYSAVLRAFCAKSDLLSRVLPPWILPLIPTSSIAKYQ